MRWSTKGGEHFVVSFVAFLAIAGRPAPAVVVRRSEAGHLLSLGTLFGPGTNVRVVLVVLGRRKETRGSRIYERELPTGIHLSSICTNGQ
jgi:hypothetical protein